MDSSNATQPGAQEPKRLVRMPSSGRIAGVCSGIAEYLDTDVTLVRLAWIILSIVPGGLVGGVIAYVAAWIVMPESTTPLSPGDARHLMRSPVDRKIAGVCGGLAEYLRADSTLIRLLWVVLTVFPGAIVFGIVAYAVAWFIMPEQEAPRGASAPSAA